MHEVRKNSAGAVLPARVPDGRSYDEHQVASSYEHFLLSKSQLQGQFGFSPASLPSFLYPFQSALVTWALEQGRGALFADCGLGKTPMQLTWADQVCQRTDKPVLILTPLAVGAQTVDEAAKFGIRATRDRDGSGAHDWITVTNYEQLHHFTPSDFGGVVCDESSIIKSFGGATQSAVTHFMSQLKFRLLCTATAAPNDYVELGTSSEALGSLGMIDMLRRFFTMAERISRREQLKGVTKGAAVAKTGAEWTLKPHAETHFWRWVCSWARAARTPADVGFPDDQFVLPPLIENEHTVTARTLPSGHLFQRVAVGLQEEREERRRTMQERCEYVADLVRHDRSVVVWCHLNEEGDRLARLIPGSRQVKGGDTDDEKEQAFTDFSSGRLRVLITKPKIGAWGLNWQHCNHVVTFASHSYEQYYQSVRRCWRFGQTQPVTVDIVSTEGESGVRANMRRKGDQAAEMFSALVHHMHAAMTVERRQATTRQELPAWLSTTR